MVNKTFQADFFRMTGRHYGGSFRDHFQILLRHNLRYMWWYRKYSEKSRIPVVNIYIYYIAFLKNTVLRYVQNTVEKACTLDIPITLRSVAAL